MWVSVETDSWKNANITVWLCLSENMSFNEPFRFEEDCDITDPDQSRVIHLPQLNLHPISHHEAFFCTLWVSCTKLFDKSQKKHTLQKREVDQRPDQELTPPLKPAIMMGAVKIKELLNCIFVGVQHKHDTHLVQWNSLKRTYNTNNYNILTLVVLHMD